MPKISFTISKALDSQLNDIVRQGKGLTRQRVVRQALECYVEDMAVEAVLRSEQEVREGKILHGDLDQLAARMT